MRLKSSETLLWHNFLSPSLLTSFLKVVEVFGKFLTYFHILRKFLLSLDIDIK